LKIKYFTLTGLKLLRVVGLGRAVRDRRQQLA